MRPSRKLAPIASRVARRLERFLEQKVVDLSAIREGKMLSEKLRGERPDLTKALSALHPAHAAYAFVMNEVSILVETLSELDDVARLCEVIGRAEDEYVPSGPPMSPVTHSFFNSWSFFDCGIGIERETFGTILLALADRLRMHPEFAAILSKWQESRFGIFELERPAGQTALLRELVTEDRIEAINPTMFTGKPGSIWYVRALPPPTASFANHVIVTTPYELTAPNAPGWMAFLERTLPKTRIADSKRAYAHLMKWGLSNKYWSEYVFEAYANHETNAVWLMGLPDVPESRPHSRMNEDGDGALRTYLTSGRMATGALA